MDAREGLQKAVEQNTWPSPTLRVATGFRLRRSIDTAGDQGADILATDDSRRFLLSHHLKGVCNSNLGGRNSRQTLSPGY